MNIQEKLIQNYPLIIERITYVKNNSNDSIVRFEAEMMLEANEMYD